MEVVEAPSSDHPAPRRGDAGDPWDHPVADGDGLMGSLAVGPGTRVILPVIGIICICLGLVLMIATIRLFVTVGKGTLAPWEPPQRLVVRGIYCHVRNPMMSGALFVLLGEAVLAASLPLSCWFAFAGVVYAVYIPLSEEPGLVKRFGEEYLTYKQNVPRWIPRLTPWEGDPAHRR